MIAAEEFAERRKRLMTQMCGHSIAILSAAPECLRNGDAHYPYRPDSNFYYLTGFNEPEAVAIFAPGRAAGEYILFNRTCDPEKEVWTGKRAGQMGACELYAADQAFPIEELDKHLADLLAQYQCIYYSFNKNYGLEARIKACLNNLNTGVRAGVAAPFELINVEKILHEQRLLKSPAEINLMRQAAKISAQAHKRAMQACKPGKFEYQLEAEIVYEFIQQGARSPAYESIVAAGKNACVLHYVDNTDSLQVGELLLIDAGAEYQYYASDITRTFPINGRFSPEQRIIYELVLKAQLAVIESIRPGLAWNELQPIAARIITEGLLLQGLLQGDLEELLQGQAYRRFYMHNIGHWLGMDVHDVGDYQVNAAWRLLEPGMVLTVEPGIYIAPGAPDIPEKWWGIGVRIEDDVLVTETGSEVLSADAPKTIAELESII